MYKAGNIPGEGYYLCTRCLKEITLGEDDVLEPCPACKCRDFL